MIAWAELVSLSCLRIVDFVVCAPAVRIDDDNTIRFYVEWNRRRAHREF